MISWRRTIFGIGVFFCGISFSLAANPPEISAADLPRFPPIPATNAVQTFKIQPPFRLQLVAAEPLVVDPIAMSFDEEGRLFVVEMRDYPEGATNAISGRIRMLVDTNSDGVFDTSTVYADNLSWPSAVICYDGGVFVAATPEILFFKDTNGDGVADTREVVFTGFGNAVPKLNVQSIVNGFTWGLDNRIHGVTGGNGGNITAVKSGQPGPIPLRGKDFSFDPQTLRLEPESGTAQYGMSFDNRGRKFVCDNSHHAKLVMYEARYAARNPFYAMPLPIIDIAPPAAPIYRISPDEPWRVIRTRWRTTGVMPSGGIQDGGGRVSGYFSAASGITIYRGSAFPIEYQDTEFVCDCGGNLVHHDNLRANGLELIAQRAGIDRTEFLASRDTWFRPVALANAPDGTLYVADMYREIIEHPWALPDTIKKHLDLNSGNDRGRIYRIIPSNFKQPPPFKLSNATTAQLAAILAHPNGWHRDTAARLLYQRQDKAAVPILTRLASESPSALGRLHMLCALDGLHALTETHVLRALGDSDERVREHGLRLSEKLIPLNGAMSDSLWNALRAARLDSSIRVRYQVAFTAGEARHLGKVAVLSDILGRDLGDKWIRAAVLSSLGEGAGEMLAATANDKRFNSNQTGREFLGQLALMAGAKNDRNEVLQIMNVVFQMKETQLGFTLLDSLGDGLERAKSALANFDRGTNLPAVYNNALLIASDGTFAIPLRVEAVRLLSHSSFVFAGGTLLSMLQPNEVIDVQLAALNSLGKFNEPEVGAGILQRWKTMTPRARSEALTVLLARPNRMAALLAGIRTGLILPAELNASQVKLLTEHRDPQLREQALKVLGQPKVMRRQDAIQQFQPAAKMGGNQANGREIFRARCASCHQLGGEGHAVGPDLASVRLNGKEKILLSILDPNLEVAPNYLAYSVDTKDGESVLGLIVNETPTSITVRQANGVERVIFTSNIDKVQSQEQSLMPEGLESGMTVQQMADLLEFIMNAPSSNGRY